MPKTIKAKAKAEQPKRTYRDSDVYELISVASEAVDELYHYGEGELLDQLNLVIKKLIRNRN